MPTTKKTVTVKKKTSVAKRTADAVVSGEYFIANSGPAVVNVPKGQVLLVINNANKGLVPHGGKTLGVFVNDTINQYNIRTATVFADGKKADTGWVGKSMAQFAKIEIHAKDARG